MRDAEGEGAACGCGCGVPPDGEASGGKAGGEEGPGEGEAGLEEDIGALRCWVVGVSCLYVQLV